MKPDLRGINQWGPGRYSELRKQQEIKPRKRHGEAARAALKEKKSKHRYLISINPELAEFARVFGQGKLSTGINQIIHIAKLSGATPISDFVSGDIYENLNVQLAGLRQRIESIERTMVRSRKKQITFPATPSDPRGD